MPNIIDDCPQGSPDWLQLRVGIPTASEFDRLITPEFKARTGKGPKTYLAEKIAEHITHAPLTGFSGSFAADQGVILEPRARGWFEFERDCKIRQVSFVESDDGRCGCSPDGLIGDDAGIEIKCPAPQTHVKYLLAGGLPKDYALQVHGSLFVTGRARWHFLSFCPRFPALLITVERDEEIMTRIGAALSDFYDDFDAALEKLQPKTVAD